MEIPDIQNPHDKFFKEIFSEKEEVTAFISQVLSKELVKNLDLNSLTLDNTSYVDENLEDHFSDLVYNCTYQGKAKLLITLLFEHKSYQSTTIPIHFQLLKYMLKIWEQRLSQKEVLSPIIPLLIYHGKNQWNKKSMMDYFEESVKVNIPSAFHQFLPSFDYVLIDLNTYQDEEIRKIFPLVSLQISLLLMKKIFEKQLENELRDIFSAIRDFIKTEKGKRIFRTLLLYLYSATKIKINKIMETMQSISLEAQEETLTIAQNLILQGKLEERNLLISNMLKKGLKTKEVADLTGIELKTVKEIETQIKKK